ncbi:DinB family protein [bacterium]|nr:DinB family protein [bacterium]
MKDRKELQQDFTEIFTEIKSLIQEVENNHFNHKESPEKWSIAQEFDHILRSNLALAHALKYPSLVLKRKFGKPNRPLRTYHETYDRYYEKLSAVQNPLAPSKYRNESDKPLDKNQLLKSWDQCLNKLNRRLNRWSERSLNNTLLAHPLLGKMYVREFLYFTHFHTLHHLKGMKSKL